MSLRTIWNSIIGFIGRFTILANRVGLMLVLPFILLVVGVPVVTACFALGLPNFGKFILLWGIAYPGTTMLFGIVVSLVIVLKLFKNGCDFAASFPRLAVAIFGGSTNFQFGLTPEYIQGFKQMVMGITAWYGFFTFVCMIIPLQNMVEGLVILYLSFIILAAMQEGWAEHPPKLSRWLANFIVATMFTGVVVKVLFPGFSAASWHFLERTAHISAVKIEQGGQWMLDKTGVKEEKPPEVIATGTNVQTTPSSNLSQSANIILSLVRERDVNESNGFHADAQSAQTRIGARCVRIVSDDCDDGQVKQACPLQCR